VTTRTIQGRNFGGVWAITGGKGWTRERPSGKRKNPKIGVQGEEGGA